MKLGGNHDASRRFTSVKRGQTSSCDPVQNLLRQTNSVPSAGVQDPGGGRQAGWRGGEDVHGILFDEPSGPPTT
jgi:hypothetical protein